MAMTTDQLTEDQPRTPRAPGREELRKEARAQFWKRIVQASLVTALVLILGFSAVTLYLIRDTQVGNRTTLKKAKDAAASAARTADRVEDCTTPGGDCFEQAQRQTSGAVAGINTITVRATACLAVVLKRIPDGTQVNVDDVAQAIQECIRSTTASVTPQKVAPVPRTSTVPTTTTSPEPKKSKKSKKHKHPKVAGTPGVPTPTPSPTSRPGVLEPICELLLLDPCPLS